MSTASRLAKNTATLFASQAVMLLLSTVFTVYLARLLGPANYGKYVFASSFPAIFFVSFTFLSDLAVRDVARDKSSASNYLGSIVTLKIFLCSILLLLIYYLLRLMGYPQDTAIAVYAFSLYFFLQRITSSFSAIFIAHEKLSYSAVSAAIEKLVIVSLALLLLSCGSGLTGFVWVFVFGGFFRLLALSILIRPYAKLRLRFNPGLYRYLFKIGYPMLLASLFGVLISKIGVVILSKLKGDQAVGLYGIGYGLYIVVTIVATSFNSSLFPLFSKYSLKQREKSVALYKISFRLLFACAVLLMVAVLALADRIVLLFFKQAYLDSTAVIRIIFLGLPLFFVRNLLATILISINRQKRIMPCLAAGLLLHLILSFALIPRVSYLGASIAFVATELVVFSTLFYFVRRHFSKLDLLAILLKSSIAGGLTYLFLLYLGQGNLFFVALGGTIIFLGLLLLLKFFSKQQLVLMKETVFNG
ncbi:flippase [Candidatus Omnitrophota bacterium]